ncbi:MAG: dihydrofolate reductase [Burkholderiales bacterium]
MNRPVIALIAALARNRAIGLDNRMPWHLPDDLRRFRQLTTGHRVIMGRKTFDSIGRPLPGRTNIIISRSNTFNAPGCTVVHSVDEALAGDDPTGTISFVIGGAEIYRQALSRASRMFLTEIDAEFEGDTFFPPIDKQHWNEIRRERRNSDATHPIVYDFVEYERH